MTRSRWIVVVVAVAIVAVGVTGTALLVSRSSTHSGVALPDSMASTGDSITRAFDVNAAHLLSDDPPGSWSTGSDAAVDSQYQRILAAHPAIAGNVDNDARSGSKMVALDGQLQVAAGHHVGYVTILMGANDLCTASVAAMTPTATFGSELHQALSAFFAVDPDARVFVSSIPNLFQLWQTLHTDRRAEVVWALAHICQSLLSVNATPAVRQEVVAQEQADNAVLAAQCHQFAHCRFDGDAVYNASFSAADISTVDYFHPSLAGQMHLAAITWGAGYWPADQ